MKVPTQQRTVNISCLYSWCICILLFCATYSPCFAQLPEGFVKQLIAHDLDPTSMTVAKDGRVFLTEKHGAVRLVKNDVLLEEPILELVVDNFSERGLEGIALDPYFETNPYIYLYYTVKEANHNRVSRFKFEDEKVDPTTEEILIDIDTLSGPYHNGGSLLFGLDDKLYISTGEGTNYFVSQQVNSLLGKVLRLNPDGSIPESNPFYNVTEGKYRAIYALGFRNPFTMNIDRKSGKIFLNDVGNAMYEEINEVLPGKNYGWSVIEGYAKEGQTLPLNYMDPLFAYDHDFGCAIVGGTMYNPEQPNFPEGYVGKYIFGDYCANVIRVIDLETKKIDTLVSDVVRPIGLQVSNNGTLYFFSRNGIAGGSNEANTGTEDGELWRLSYENSNRPYIYQQPESALYSVSEDAVFTVSASGKGPLNYQWRENGQDIAGATDKVFTYKNLPLSADQNEYQCVVYNNTDTIVSFIATLHVTANTRPQLNITLPVDTFKYSAGDTIVFMATAHDLEDGELPAENLKWTIHFHHNTHFHPVVTNLVGVDSSAFVVDRNTETSSNVWFRIYLTGSDSEGLSRTISKEIYPVKSTVKIRSNVLDLQGEFDSKTQLFPFEFIGVSGVLRHISVPVHFVSGDTLYTFKEWSSGFQDPDLLLATPAHDSTLTAVFTGTKLDTGNGLTGMYYNELKGFTTTPVLTRTDQDINFDWMYESPSNEVNADEFSVRWIGYLNVPFDDKYTFYLGCDDGAKLFIDDQLIIDNWRSQPFTEESVIIESLSRGFHKIKIEYYDQNMAATAKLSWSSSGIPKSIISKIFFYQHAAPIIVIGQPENGAVFLGGQAVSYKGKANDGEDNSPIAIDALTWQIDSRDVLGNFVQVTSVHTDSSGFIIPNDNIYRLYRLTFTAEGVNGRRGSEVRYINSIPATGGTGLIAEYFETDNSLLKETTDSQINFDWNTDPVPDAIVSRTFTTNWRGYLQVPFSDLYNISINGNGKLWLDDALVIDNSQFFNDEAGVKIQLDASKKHKLKATFKFDSLGRVAIISWSSSMIVKNVIPKNAFSLNTTPQLSIKSPIEGDTLFTSLRTQLVGVATDAEDGILDGNHFHWRIEALNDDKKTELIALLGSDSTEFIVPDTNTSPYFRISLDVQDNFGDTTTVSKDFVVSADVEKHINDVSVFPNPTTKLFKVQFRKAPADMVTVTLYNAIGKRIFNNDCYVDQFSRTLQVNLEDIESGYYTMHILGRKINVKRKIVKLH